jgi:hypothetical protein
LGGIRHESLLDPCGAGKFADSGQNQTNQAAYKENSLINSLEQGNSQKQNTGSFDLAQDIAMHNSQLVRGVQTTEV